jgi:hypothetical protein
LIVEVMADATLGRKHTGVKEDQVCIQRLRVDQGHVVQLACSSMGPLRFAVFSRIQMRDALGQRLAGE